MDALTLTLFSKLPDKTQEVLKKVIKKLSENYTGTIELHSHNGVISKCHDKRELS